MQILLQLTACLFCPFLLLAQAPVSLTFPENSASVFELIGTDTKNHKVFVLNRDRDAIKTVQVNNQVFEFKNSAKLNNQNGDLIAKRKKNQVFLPQSDLVIKRSCSDTNWTYKSEEEVILDLSYNFNETTKNYEIFLEYDLQNKDAQIIVAFAMRTFEKEIQSNNGILTTASIIGASLGVVVAMFLVK